MEELSYVVPLGLAHSEFLSWPAMDQDKALAFLRRKALSCSGCGTRREEWDKDRYAYVASAQRCTGCELIAMESEQVPPHEKGIRIGLVLNRGAH